MLRTYSLDSAFRLLLHELLDSMHGSYLLELLYAELRHVVLESIDLH